MTARQFLGGLPSLGEARLYDDISGRFDATNVIQRPATSVIMPVSLDHQAYLGDRAELIAAEGMVSRLICAQQDHWHKLFSDGIDAAYVDSQLASIARNTDLSRFVL